MLFALHRKVLESASRLNATRRFHWVGSDGWGKQTHLVEGLEDVAVGAITVELTSKVRIMLCCLH